jgi:hypothetical protein
MPPASRTGLRDGRAAGRGPTGSGRSGAGRGCQPGIIEQARVLARGRAPVNVAVEPAGAVPGQPGYRRVRLPGAPRPVVPSRWVIREVRENAHTATDLLGNLVAQTAGSRRAGLDVLHPVTPAARRPCQRFGSAGERAHSPRRAWLPLRRAVSGCGDPVSHQDRASRPVQEALPRVPGSGRRAGPRCQAAARQVLPWRCGPRPVRRSRDVTAGYQPGGASRRVRGRPRSPGPLARSGRRRRSWPPTAAPPRVRARRGA